MWVQSQCPIVKKGTPKERANLKELNFTNQKKEQKVYSPLWQLVLGITRAFKGIERKCFPNTFKKIEKPSENEEVIVIRTIENQANLKKSNL